MRWDELFDDLESQLERELASDDSDLEAEEERLRLGRLSVRDRLLAVHTGSDDARIVITLVTGERMTVRPVAFGRDWFSADVFTDSARRAQCIVPVGALIELQLTADQVSDSLEPVGGRAHPALSDRLGLAFVLRDLCRRRRGIEVVTAAGRTHGTIDRVGRDHFDLAVHERGSVRRESRVTERKIVAFAAVVLLRL
jgi:hypothetical protein